MHLFEKKMLRFCRSHSLFPRGAGVTAAVSGGADSVAMLAALAELRDELGLGRLGVVYVDHGLRPEETPAERELVAALALRFSCLFIVEEVDVRGHGEREGISLEAAAREQRYAALARAAGGDGIIAVAHHGDDQAEELLIRLIRGTGLAGLAGMLPDNRLGVARPLLGHTRAEIDAYIKERGLSYCHDSSNADSTFLRNRVRHELLPFLGERFNPAISGALRRAAAIIAVEDDFVRRQSDTALAACWRLLPDGGGEILLSVFQDMHPAIQRRVIDAALWAVACPATMERIESLRELASGGRNGARLHLPTGLRVTRQRQRLLFAYPLGRKAHRRE